jgi:hypothetical protein
MAQKKTVFERLEDKMIELEEKLDSKLTQLQTSIDSLKDDIPRSLGENLMSFTDMIGAKIEDLEEILKTSGTSGGQSLPSGNLNALKADLDGIKDAIDNLKLIIQKMEAPTPVASPPTTISPNLESKSKTSPSPTPLTSSTSTVTTTTSKATPSAASSLPPGTGGLAQVIQLLDSIKEKARSNLTSNQLANEMEQTRDTIVKIFRWHPALYELATFARRLKKAPQGANVDAETQQLLLEKIDEWKNRVSSQ